MILKAVPSRHKLRAQAFVLHVDPTRPNAKPEPIFGEESYLRCLLCHQGRLALGKHEDSRDELDPLSNSGKEREKRQRFVEDMGFGIDAA